MICFEQYAFSLLTVNSPVFSRLNPKEKVLPHMLIKHFSIF